MLTEWCEQFPPLDGTLPAYLPQIYLAARQYDRARQEAQQSVELEPHAPLARWQLGRAYLFSNQAKSAVAALEQSVTLAGPESMWESELSYARARAGDHSGALAILSRLLERARRAYVSPYDLAIAFTGIGDHESALDYLEQAFTQRVMRIVAIGDPEFDELRGKPRFTRLVARLRLPPMPA